jgi:hypothetical protein
MTGINSDSKIKLLDWLRKRLIDRNNNSSSLRSGDNSYADLTYALHVFIPTVQSALPGVPKFRGEGKPV